MTTELSQLSAAPFRPLIGDTFYILLPDAPPLALILKQVDERPQSRLPSASPEQRMPFSLLLTGDKNEPFLTGVLPLRHATLGTLPDLLLNRVMPSDGIMDPQAWYQINFN